MFWVRTESLYNVTEHRVLVCFCSYVSVYTAGIGQGRVTDNLNGASVDRAILVKDSEAVAMVCNTYVHALTHIAY